MVEPTVLHPISSTPAVPAVRRTAASSVVVTTHGGVVHPANSKSQLGSLGVSNTFSLNNDAHVARHQPRVLEGSVTSGM